VGKVIDGHMTKVKGAATLGITVRQITRLKHTHKAEEEASIAHKNRGKQPVHDIPEGIKDQIASLYKSKYHGSNSCHFAELLQEHKNIVLSDTSVRRIFLDHRLIQTKQKRRSKTHQSRQSRA
jgi:hypothetical protein